MPGSSVPFCGSDGQVLWKKSNAWRRRQLEQPRYSVTIVLKNNNNSITGGPTGRISFEHNVAMAERSRYFWKSAQSAHSAPRTHSRIKRGRVPVNNFFWLASLLWVRFRVCHCWLSERKDIQLVQSLLQLTVKGFFVIGDLPNSEKESRLRDNGEYNVLCSSSVGLA